MNTKTNADGRNSGKEAWCWRECRGKVGKESEDEMGGMMWSCKVRRYEGRRGVKGVERERNGKEWLWTFVVTFMVLRDEREKIRDDDERTKNRRHTS